MSRDRHVQVVPLRPQNDAAEIEGLTPSRETSQCEVVTSRAPLRIAEAFVNSRRRPLVHYAGMYFERLGTVYTPLSDRQLSAEIYQRIDRMLVESATEHGVERKFLEANRQRVGEVLAALVAVVPSVHGDPPIRLDGECDFDPLEAIVTPTGVLDLRTRILRPVGADFFAISGVAVPFDSNAEAPDWLAFLESLWGDDCESIETLQEWFGYVLTADTRQQKILALIGPRRSGKGTIGRVLDALIGAENIAHPTLGDFERPFGLAPLIGRQLAIVGDARLGGRADQAAIAERLLSISGEDSQTIDRKHRDAVTVRLRTRIMIISNEAPRLSDSSSALASRFIVLCIQPSFLGREDKGLEARLLRQLPGILRWAVDGWTRLERRGHFVQPTSGAHIAEEIETLGSPYRTFAQECVEFGAGYEAPTQQVYLRWKRWCGENGIKDVRTKAVFSRDLRAAFPFFRDAQRVRGSARFRVFVGLRVRK